MRKTLFSILAALALTAPAVADDKPRAPAGPDFSGDAPSKHRADDLSASEGKKPLEPMAVLLFAFDSAKLSAVDASQLESAVNWLAAHPRELLVIEGYADPTGSRAYNIALSQRRAEAVNRKLVELGVPPSRIVIGTFGEALATSPNAQANRRVIVRGTRAKLDQVIARTQVDDGQPVFWSYQPRAIATR
jgi:peptidoglycan-associated lipoprotein